MQAIIECKKNRKKSSKVVLIFNFLPSTIRIGKYRLDFGYFKPKYSKCIQTNGVLEEKLLFKNLAYISLHRKKCKPAKSSPQSSLRQSANRQTDIT